MWDLNAYKASPQIRHNYWDEVYEELDAFHNRYNDDDPFDLEEYYTGFTDIFKDAALTHIGRIQSRHKHTHRNTLTA